MPATAPAGRAAACHRPRSPPCAPGPEFTTRYPDGRNHVMHTANSTGTYESDPFDLGAVLVIDTAAAGTPLRCATDDGCSPTCASACNSTV
jgi:FxLD family lantipeptide